MRFSIERLHEGRGALCDRILRELPGWFGIEASVQQYVRDVEGMVCFAALAGGSAVGFIALHQHNESTIEIHVMGVEERHHRAGIGRLLVEAAVQHARDRGCRLLSVKTLAPSRPSDEYERTRRFYRATGFIPVEEFRTLWGEANPCLLLVRPL